MRGKTISGALLVLAWLALAPGGAWAQEFGGTAGVGDFSAGYAPADPQLPLPIGSTRPEDGGFFPFLEYVMFRQTNPLKSQLVAVRGLTPVDASVAGVAPNTNMGSGATALDVSSVSGPNGYQPGFNVGLGYKFSDGSTISASFLYIADNQNRADASLAPAGLNVGPNFVNSFLSSPVFAFPAEYSGPNNKVGVGSPQAFFGIWNAASVMTEQFTQRFEQYDITYRRPIYETECYRISGTMGPRMVWIWERYQWTTTDLPPTGVVAPEDSAVYNNIVSNRMYGAHIGTQQEWYLGHGFACTLGLEAALYIDSVKEQAKYQLGLHETNPTNKRAYREWTLVPSLNGNVGMSWYPTEFIELRLGYNVMSFFNTISSPRPIDYSYSALDPKWVSTSRFYDGLNVGIGIQF